MAAPRVLVIRGGAIGDFILTLPAIRLLRESIPGIQLEILGYKPILDLALAGGLAEATRHLEHGSMAKLFVPNVPLEEALLEYFRGFNLVVSYLYDPDGYFRGNMERIGVKTFLEASHRVVPGEGHAAEQLARPLERLAMYLEDPAPRLDLAASAAVPQDRPILAMHPGSGSTKKNWPLDRWIATGRELASRYPQWRLALVTGEAELERGTTAAILTGWQGINFLHWDQLPLPELGHRLAASSAFLGHDSGIGHLAAAVGLRSLLLFGPTDPAIWAPKNAGVRILLEETGDLAELSATRVWEESATLLADGPQKTHSSTL